VLGLLPHALYVADVLHATRAGPSGDEQSPDEQATPLALLEELLGAHVIQ
jgi:hypothetical protein